MKKKTLALIAALSVIMVCTGCGNKASEKKDETTTTTTTTAAAAEAPEDTTASETEAPAETTGDSQETSQDASGKTALMTLPGGRTLYSEDGIAVSEWDGGFIKGYEGGYVCLSTGFYRDSFLNPELFDIENYEYSGETPELGEIKEVKVGDKLGDLTVKSTELQISGSDGGEAYVFGNNVDLDGELTLTGVMRYYYDEQYGIMSGDIIFVPDSCYAGLPMACDPTWDNVHTYASFDTIEIFTDDGIEKKDGSGPAYYSDTQRFKLGNLFENYADNGEVSDVVNGGNDNVSKKVQVTISDISLSYSDQFGTGHSSAKIKSIKAI